MAEASWIVFAIAAMLLFAAGNLALKYLSESIDLSKYPIDVLLPAAGLIALSAIAAYLVFLPKLKMTNDVIIALVLLVIFSVAGFYALIKAMQLGKTALVSTVLALGAVVVAIGAFLLFNEKLNAKEVGALVLAILSIIVLVS
ncbi:EamA family transporter [Candidatus Micrarchaeota archaeon]|nr:EamA family transporter [Candidatus Micrarchaeota archaeon]